MLGKEPIFTIHAELEAITSLGQTPYGERRMIGILGGTVRGARLAGRILPGGADWQIIRRDGAADIKARYTIETETGALIMVNSEGLRHGPPEIIEKLARGENVDPRKYYFRTVMRSRPRLPRSTGSTGSWRSPKDKESRAPCGSTSTKWSDGCQPNSRSRSRSCCRRLCPMNAASCASCCLARLLIWARAFSPSFVR